MLQDTIRETKVGTKFNIDHIRQVDHHRNAAGDTSTVIHWSGGSTETHPGRLDLERPATIIPAAPGFVQLTYVYLPHKDQPHVDRDAIVAWRVRSWGIPQPVAVDFDPQITPDVAAQAILAPDGTVFAPFEGRWPNIDAWLAAMNQRQAKLKEEDAARAVADDEVL
jgi:hypothetical protein